MAKLTVWLLVHFIIIAPLVALTFNRSKARWKHLFLFVLYYYSYAILLALPNWFPELRIVESAFHWNWSGKMYAITGSLLFYFIFKNAFVNHDYITLKQNKNTLRPIFVVSVLVFVLAIGLAFVSVNQSDERVEYFLFQFTMPGLDEELAFRGIMLGLLSNALSTKTSIGAKNIGNPALLITSILFGLVHSMYINNDWSFHQNWFEFFNAFVIGLLLGWITIKSSSILMSIVIHSLINVLPSIVLWIF